MSDEESTGTVLLALGANVAIAVAKIAAGIISGSSAMLAEGVRRDRDLIEHVRLSTDPTVKTVFSRTARRWSAWRWPRSGSACTS